MTNSLKLFSRLLIVGIVSISSARCALAEVTAEGDVLPVLLVLEDENWILNPDWAAVEFGGDIGDLAVGNTGTGRLIIDIPGFTDPLVSPTGIIGKTSTGIGLVKVEGFTSEWNMYTAFDNSDPENIIEGVAGSLTVGDAGQGFLDIYDGGIVRSSAGVDDEGNPTGLPVTVVGNAAGSQGFITVADFGSLWQTGALTLANAGYGSLLVQNRGNVQSSTVVVGALQTAVSQIVVEDLGARWNNTDNMTIGQAGRATMTIRNQGIVNTGVDAMIGLNTDTFDSYGKVVVDGQGSLWTIGNNLYVGNTENDDAQGELHLLTNGLVQVQQGTTIARGGLLVLDGGTLVSQTLVNNGIINGSGRVESVGTGAIPGLTNNVTGVIRNAVGADSLPERILVTGPVENSGRIESLGGEMEFESAVTNNADGQIIGSDAILRFGGQLVNSGTLEFSLGESHVYGQIQNSSGAISVANDANVTFYDDVSSGGNMTVMAGGTSAFMEDLQLDLTSVLALQIGDSDSSSGLSLIQVFGSLNLGGGDDLGGTLIVSLFAGFTPEVGDSFQILTGQSVTGTFDPDLLVLPEVPGLMWDVDYLSTNVVLRALLDDGTILGDFNGDGTVDDLDLATWEQNFGTLVGSGTDDGDADGDGDVDGADFLTWQRQYGSSGGGAATASVPEPASLWLALLAVLAIRFRRL